MAHWLEVNGIQVQFGVVPVQRSTLNGREDIQETENVLWVDQPSGAFTASAADQLSPTSEPRLRKKHRNITLHLNRVGDQELTSLLLIISVM